VGKVNSVEFDGYVGTSGTSWSFSLKIFDEDDNELFYDLSTGQTDFNSWVKKDYVGINIENASYLRFVVGMEGSGIDLWMDNLATTYIS